MIERDGFGDPLRPDGRYYVQDSRTIVGNCALWWAKEGRGYVCDLDAAGVFTGAEVAKMRVTDVPYPEGYVLDHTTRHVRIDVLRRPERNRT